jgi:hypothetical protein
VSRVKAVTGAKTQAVSLLRLAATKGRRSSASRTWHFGTFNATIRAHGFVGLPNLFCYRLKRCTGRSLIHLIGKDAKRRL